MGCTGVTAHRLRPLFLLPLLGIILIGAVQPLRLVHASTAWSSPILIDAHPTNNQLSSSLQGSNGTLWITFDSDRNAQTTGRYDIIYKTYTNGVWSGDHNLTTSGQNLSPYLAQLANGTIAVYWTQLTGHSFDIFYTQYTQIGWSSPIQITSTIYNDTQPSATVDRSGTVWLVWTRVNSTNINVPAVKQLFYKTWTNGAWSPEKQLTTDSNQNYGSNVMVAKDGIIRVTWSKGTAGNTYQLYQKTYNGTAWSSDAQIVSSSSTDERPTMVQDRNGTLWLFWGRLIVISALLQYYEIWGQYSYNIGTTWSSQIQLTPTPGTKTFDSFQPSAVQSNYGVKPLWIFYTSNYNEPNYDIYALQSSGIYPVHDVIVSGTSSSNNLGTKWEYPGGLKSVGQSAIETITVTVFNIGDYVENVFVTPSATNRTVIVIGTHNSLVGPGNTMNFYFYWNTTNVPPGRYGISVSIAALPGESLGNMGDNSYSVTNQVHIIPLGDIDQDGSVTISDVSQFFYDYNFTPACNCSRWNPYGDINNNNIIDITDLGIVLANFNKYT